MLAKARYSNRVVTSVVESQQLRIHTTAFSLVDVTVNTERRARDMAYGPQTLGGWLLLAGALLALVLVVAVHVHRNPDWLVHPNWRTPRPKIPTTGVQTTETPISTAGTGRGSTEDAPA